MASVSVNCYFVIVSLFLHQLVHAADWTASPPANVTQCTGADITLDWTFNGTTKFAEWFKDDILIARFLVQHPTDTDMPTIQPSFANKVEFIGSTHSGSATTKLLKLDVADSGVYSVIVTRESDSFVLRGQTTLTVYNSTTCTVSFAPAEHVVIINNQDIQEGSGLAASSLHPGVLYTHNGGNDKPRLFAIDKNTGHTLATITINMATNSDWEDIAVGPCGQGQTTSCIYIADTGLRRYHMLYRIKEPAFVGTQSVDIDSKFNFHWFGHHDHDQFNTLMVDPDGEVYIITNHAGNAQMAHLPNSGWGNGTTTIHYQNAVQLTVYSNSKGPTAGDISPDGKEVILVYHDSVHHWSVPNGDYMTTMSHDNGTSIPAIRAAEGVAWDERGSGFYLIQEGLNPPLMYYQRQY